jgi:hypothetical protein
MNGRPASPSLNRFASKVNAFPNSSFASAVEVLYCDPSAWVKRYVQEAGCTEVHGFFDR